MNKCIFILLFFTATYLKSQSDNNNELKIEGKPAKWDTLKYHKFSRAIIVGLFQQFRNFNNTFEQNIIKDSTGISSCTYERWTVMVAPWPEVTSSSPSQLVASASPAWPMVT